jgi:archaellum component FlaC
LDDSKRTSTATIRDIEDLIECLEETGGSANIIAEKKKQVKEAKASLERTNKALKDIEAGLQRSRALLEMGKALI